jgi:hypothetical protein
MAFIEKKIDGLEIDDSEIGIKNIVEAFGTLIEKKGFDFGVVSCGLSPSPDFGYFELADRFWRASLCIYSFGSTSCFWERGAGYVEPWLFNTRHAVELYIKGLLLNTIWLEELQINPRLSVKKEEFTNLRRELLRKPHNLLDLYNSHEDQIANVISNWNIGNIPEIPEIKYLVLKVNVKEMLSELDEADRTSFRFRFPSLKQDDLDSLQKINWHHDKSMLFPKTGLPKKAGYFFDHVVVINHLYELINELKAIANYFKGINLYQDVMNDYWDEYLTLFNDEGYEY